MGHCVIRWKRNTRTRLQSEVLQAEEDCFLLIFIETLLPDYAIIIYIIKLKKLNLFFYLKTLVSSGQLCGKLRIKHQSKQTRESNLLHHLNWPKLFSTKNQTKPLSLASGSPVCATFTSETVPSAAIRTYVFQRHEERFTLQVLDTIITLLCLSTRKGFFMW